MTAIAAIATGKKVYIGGDSAGIGGDLSLELRKDTKVFSNGDFLFGFSESFRMGQLLRYTFKPPKRAPKTQIVKYMFTKFIEAVRKCLKTGGCIEVVNGVESCDPFIVGYKGRIFVVDSDFQIRMPQYDFCAVGCGQDLCLGSLYTTRNMRMQPNSRIKLALETAEAFCAGVRGPFILING